MTGLVEAHSSGRTRIGGEDYTGDVIVGAGLIKPNWWRGESIECFEEHEGIIKLKPEVVVFGTDANERVKVEKKVVEKLKGVESDVVIRNTKWRDGYSVCDFCTTGRPDGIGQMCA